MKTLLALLFVLSSQLVFAQEKTELFYDQSRAVLYKDLATLHQDILTLKSDEVKASLKAHLFAADESQEVKECFFRNLSSQDGLNIIRDFVTYLNFVSVRSTIISKSIAKLPNLGFHEYQLDTQISATASVYQSYLEKEVLFRQLYKKTTKLCK